jgi:hypothetical protein
MRELRVSKRQLETVLAFLLPVSGKTFFYLKLFTPLRNETSGLITYMYINTYKDRMHNYP